jgi:predicted nucleic-acid-binding protein
MRAADTNILVRIVTRDDERQALIADAFIQKGAWVSHLVLAETAWVLRDLYDVEHEGIASIIEMLLQHESLTIEAAEVVAAALVQYRHRPRLGFSDCLVLEIARKAGHLPLGTFDRDLSKIDGAERL